MQNRQLRALARLADTIFVSTTRWIAEIQDVFPRAVCHHLPVGSNLPASKLYEGAPEKEDLSRHSCAGNVWLFTSEPHDGLMSAASAPRRRSDKMVVLYVGKDGKSFREVCAGFAYG
jgi:hypothetical protein